MKKFIIINGTTTKIIERENLESAIMTAENLSDHSKEIIVREVKEFTDYSKVYVNEPLKEKKTETIREKIINALWEHSSDELRSVGDMLEIAKMSESQLVDNLISCLEYYSNEYNNN